MNNENKLPKVLVIGINAWREDGTASYPNGHLQMLGF